MDAFILAAGRGHRLRPVTDTVPKSLIPAGNSTLIELRIQALAAAGITNIVINYSHLGEQIRDHLGDGQRYGVRIRYSDESNQALETAGGIIKGLPLVESDPFLVANSDIWTDYPFADIRKNISGVAHLILVDNPEYNPDGDFCLLDERVSRLEHCGGQPLTFSGIGVYRRSLFANRESVRSPLAPLLAEAVERGLVTGEFYPGAWIDVGTPDRLRALNTLIKGCI